MRLLYLTLALILLTQGTAYAQSFTPEDTLDAIEAASTSTGVPYWWLRSIVGCETGWTYNPYARGRLGELGAAQLYPKGNALGTFYRFYNDPDNPYEAVQFLAEALSYQYKNLGPWTWSCA